MGNKVLLIGGSGLVGKAIASALQKDYQIISTAGHHKTENGYCLPVEYPARLLEILERENPDIIISSIRGDFQAQIIFHSELAHWLAEKDKRLLYVSTVNVFDGDLSRPRTEEDPPSPESAYGIFKLDCEAMLSESLGNRLIIFRPSIVWDFNCPRVRQLKDHSYSEELHHTHSGIMVNVTYAKQIGTYAKYVLDHNLRGIFHIGTTDIADYFAFEKMICEALDIKPPKFEVTETKPAVFQTAIPARKDIPEDLQMTVEQVLTALRQQK